MAVLADTFAMTDEANDAIRIEIPIETTRARAWLHAQRHAVKTYWSDRENAFEMAGVGVADCVSGTDAADYSDLLGRLRENLSCAHPDLRYYGGIRFDTARASNAQWRPFGAYRFVIPRFELLNAGGASYFICNAFRRSGVADREELDAIEKGLADIVFPDAPSFPPLPLVVLREDRPGREAWLRLVEKALGSFVRGGLEKVVLARESLLELSEPAAPMALLEEATGAGNAYQFCFQPEAGLAFFGASPERLFKRVAGFVQSEALAGTRPRGASAEADEVLADVLLHDEKELREHNYVRRCIHAAFEKLCKDVREDRDVSLARLHECQHLLCRFEGILKEGITDADLLAELHPTPAVGGYPSAEALAWIRATEPFERGGYAGPTGWVGFDSCDFAVAIRSGLASGTTLSLFAGCGLVPGSDPEREWDETENKMGTFLDYLTHHDS